MARSVEEWIGKTDDAMAPPRVRLRVLVKHDRRCANCGNKIVGSFTCDHIKAIINGGENRETNLQPLCRICTPPKDAADVAIKSKTADMAKASYGLKKPKGHPMPGSRNSPWRKPMNRNAVRRT